MRKRSLLKVLVLSPVISGVILCFQNCSPVAFHSVELSSWEQLDTCTQNPNSSSCKENNSCEFNGKKYAHGDVVKAYLGSSVPSGQTCVSEDRTCINGQFSGSYPYASCSIDGPNSCLFNGLTIAHDQSVKAYQNSTVPFGSTCVSEDRVCNNGSLGGSYNFATCSPGAASSCLFNGQTIADGQTIKAFQSSTVAFGQTCVSQDRTCRNGTLSGTYTYGSCAPGAAASCLFNGQTIADGGSATAFFASSVPYGQSCSSQSRVCSNGVLSGSYTFASCTAGTAGACVFNGQTISHGQSVTAYASSSVGFGQSCSSQSRTCNNGVLSGSYPYPGCSESSGASCYYNGQTIAHGGSVYAYASYSVPYGQYCQGQNRVCTNGSLSGSYSASSCSVDPAPSYASCSFNGQNIAHGGSVTAYASSSVPYGQSCASEVRSCNNGSLSGSYEASSCSVAPAPTYASCNWHGNIVPHGSGATAYAASSVPYGQSCASEWRTCNNGTFTGSYGLPSCTVDPAPVYASCTVSGSQVTWGEGCVSYAGTVTIPHGGSESFPAMTGWADSQGGGNITVSCNNGSISTSGGTCRLPNPGSPLMVHFNSDVNNIEPLVFTSQVDGINFDILGLNSTPVPYAPKRISWYRSPQYFFIALPNENGEVKGIDQLFGDNTQGPDGKFAKDGYKALAKFDGTSANGKKRIKAADGYITKEDAIFSKLRMWHDANFDGLAQPQELFTLEEKNVEVIDLNADPNFSEQDKYGNETTLKSVVKTKDGQYHLMFDVWFAYKNVPK